MRPREAKPFYAVEPAQAVEVTEEFVRAVDEVNDHFVVTLDIMESRASRGKQ